MKFVVIESPFAGDVDLNVEYARACLRDSLLRGEAPYASHLLYTQPGVLDDDVPEERKLGMGAGWRVMDKADLVAVYIDLGTSTGMRQGIDRARALGIPTETRRVSATAFRALGVVLNDLRGGS